MPKFNLGFFFHDHNLDWWNDQVHWKYPLAGDGLHDKYITLQNKETPQNWCSNGGKYTKTQNEIYNEDNAVSWEESVIQLDPSNHNYAHKYNYTINTYNYLNKTRLSQLNISIIQPCLAWKIEQNSKARHFYTQIKQN